MVVKFMAAFGKSQAGMSAVPVQGSGTDTFLEAVFLVLLCSYFLVSAVGALVLRKRSPLWIAAGAAHSLLLIAFLVICISGLGQSKSFGDFLGGALIVLLLGAVALVPWLGAWALTLAKAENVT